MRALRFALVCSFLLTAFHPSRAEEPGDPPRSALPTAVPVESSPSPGSPSATTAEPKTRPAAMPEPTSSPTSATATGVIPAAPKPIPSATIEQAATELAATTARIKGLDCPRGPR